MSSQTTELQEVMQGYFPWHKARQKFHRTRQTKGCGSVKATLAMVYKLALGAEKTWLRLRGANLIPLVMNGTPFNDGEIEQAA